MASTSARLFERTNRPDVATRNGAGLVCTIRIRDPVRIQETIAYGTLMMTVGLVLSLPRLSMGRHIGPGAVAAVGVLVLLTTTSVALRFGIL